MVLKLRDICLNFVAKEFKQIRNFDPLCLSSSQRELIIERLMDHDLLDLTAFTDSPLNKNVSTNSMDTNEFDWLDKSYKRDLIRCFFNGIIRSLTFNINQQVNDQFVKMIRQFGDCDCQHRRALRFRSLCINRCNKITGLYLIFSTF